MKIDSKGMSFIELLMSITIGGIVLLGASSILESELSNTKFLEKRLAISEHFIQVQDSLSKPKICTYNFNGYTFNKLTTNSISDIKYESGKIIAKVGTIKDVSINSMEIDLKTDLNLDNQYLYKLKISYKLNSAQEILKKLDILLKENSSGEVISCGLKGAININLIRKTNCEGHGGNFNSNTCTLNGLKLGNRVICDSTNEGILRYNISNGCPEICDNTFMWKPICSVP